jgi:peptidoglycan/xylan/chitin deacetylase (PgdA/CDA1 family)
MARERLACVSVDLDSLVHYCRLYGLPENELSPEARRLVYREAVGRYLDLFEETGARATFFAVGEELSDLPSAAALRAAVE